MITCPNLSNPTVKAQWDAIANNPALGNREAMRLSLMTLYLLTQIHSTALLP